MDRRSLGGLRGQFSHLNRVAAHVRFPPWRQIEREKELLGRLLNPALGDFLASVRFREIERRADWDDAGGINFGVRHVIVTLDMIEVDGLCDTGLLIQVHQVTLKVRVIDDAADVAFEVTVIDDIEPDERTEKTPVSLDDAFVEQVATFR